MGYAVSYSTPSAHVGGEPVRALMLKKEGVETSDAFSSVILDKSIEMAGYIIFSAIGLFMVLLTFNIASSFTYIAMFLALAITAFLIIVFFTKLKRNERIFVKLFKKFRLDRFKFVKKFIHKVEEIEISMSGFMNHGSKGFHQCVTITLLLWIFMYVEYYFGLKMIGVSPSLSGIFLIGVFIAISYAVPIPGALGALEAGQISIFTLLGYSPSQAIAFSLLIRARDIMRTLIGYFFLSHHGIKFFKFFSKKDKN